MTKRKHFTEFTQYELIPLDRIRYPDPDVQYLRQQADVAGDHLIDATSWTREGLLAVATCYPVLISRSATSQGMYQVLANGALLPALRRWHPEISKIPALICTGSMSRQDKKLLAMGPFGRPEVIYTAISDKSGGVEDRARLVALQGDLLGQLENFRAHVAVVVDRLRIAADWAVANEA